MPRFRKITTQNIQESLRRIQEYVIEFPEDTGVMVAALNEMLDQLLEDDFFGTGGQNDPRGDHR